MPNSPELGLQCVPNIKSVKPILPIAGTPFAKIKIQITATAKIEIQAHNRNRIFIRPSFTLLKLILRSKVIGRG